MYTVASVRNPQWANAIHTMINMLVIFEETKATYGEMPFSASPDDVEEHGRLLFLNAKNGEYGPVAEYAAPVPTAESVRLQVSNLTTESTNQINALQQEVNTLQDAVDMEMATDAEAARLAAAKLSLTAWKKYRIYLSRVEAQAGFPTSVEWPVKPA